MSVLLVEPAEAVSENVKEANTLRMDPLAATRLVTTPAQIKERIPASDYKFYNQFSEVTLYDLNGNNLVNNEYYSFVARDGDKLYMAKNNVDTDVIEFSITDKKVVENKIEEVVTNTEVEVPTTEVTTEAVVENTGEGIVSIVESTPETVVDTEEDLGEEVTIPEAEDNFSFDEITEETPTEVVSDGDGVEVQEATEEDKTADIEKRLSELNEKFNGMNNDIDTVLSQSEEKTENDDVFADLDFKVDSIENVDEEENVVNDNNSEEYDSIDDDLARAFDDLVKDNANKDRIIAEQNSELSEAKDREEKLIIENEDKDSRIKSLEQKNSLATSTIRDLRETISKYEAKLESSRTALDLQKRKSEEYKRTIGEQERELTRLRSQNEIIRNIRNTVERYKASKEYDNYEDEGSYSKVA